MVHDFKCHPVDALQEITSTMGATYWKFDADSCKIEMVGVTSQPPAESERSIVCDCNIENNACHVVNMYDFMTILFSNSFIVTALYWFS